MQCLQCDKPANEVGMLDGVIIGECEDGHRTGKLAAKQENDVMNRLGFDLMDAMTAFKVKGRKAVKRSATIDLEPVANVLDDVANGE